MGCTLGEDHRIQLYLSDRWDGASLNDLYQWYLKIEDNIARTKALSEKLSSPLCQFLLFQQADLLRRARGIRARTAEEYAIKLALWAKDNPDVRSDERTRGEDLALSLLSDLAWSADRPDLDLAARDPLPARTTHA